MEVKLSRQGQTSKYDRLANTPWTQDRYPIARRRHVSEPLAYRMPPDTVPVVIYRSLQQINVIYILNFLKTTFLQPNQKIVLQILSCKF